MEFLIAIGHIVGSLVVGLIIGISLVLFTASIGERIEKQELEEAASRLGIPVSDLGREDVVPRLVQLSSERFSSELLRNRLSDFGRVIQVIWGWFGWLVQAAVLIAVLWFTFTESTKTAVYAWTLVGIGLFFSISQMLFWFLCRLLTGRYPGQAQGARKALAEFLKSRASGC